METINYGTATRGSITVNLTEPAHHMCCPTAGRENMWAACGVDVDGNRYRVVWDFSDAEIEAAGEDASSLPWDNDHIYDIAAI